MDEFIRRAPAFYRDGDEIKPRVPGDINQGGNYLLNSTSINALNAKGAGYRFDGVNDYVNCGNDNSLNTDYITFLIDFNLDSLSLNNPLIGKGGSFFDDYLMEIEPDGFRVTIGTNWGTDDDFRYISSASANKITQAGFTFQPGIANGTIQIIKNGVIIGTQTTLSNSIGNTGSGAIGHRGIEYFPGQILTSYLFNRVLSVTEIKAYYSGAPIDFADIGANQTLIVPSDDCANDDTANWTDVNGALTFDTDHYVYTVATGASVASFADAAALTVGKRYRATILVKDGTGTGSTVRINSLTNAGAVIENGTSITVDGTYATASVEWIATETNNKVQVEIIAGSVSDGETVLFDDIETHRIGCVLQLEQDGIGHNQWLDKSGNENHGTVSGALSTNLECNHIEKYRQTVAMTNDTAWTNVVPAGYELEKIVFVESAGHAATLDLGKTSGASDVFSQVVIAASGITTKTIDKSFSTSAAQSLYLNDDGAGTWNSASVKATLFMRRVEL